MTRPNIVRADTLDLQDQDNPTAAEHNKHPTENGLAPHQRAEVDHVMQERHSEEEALADAWNISSNLSEEPDAINEAQRDHEDGAQQNGDDSANSETDGDDDMMDRISSSPSIDDGVFTIPSSPPSATAPAHGQADRTRWPKRTSSLSPSPRDTPTPTRETFNQSPLSSPAGSSPFLQTPQHLPLRVRRIGTRAPPLQGQTLSDNPSSSPFDGSPQHLPLIRMNSPREKFLLQSKCHHGRGRYTLELVPEEDEEPEDLDRDEGFYDEDTREGEVYEQDAFTTATKEPANLTSENESDRSVIIHRRPDFRPPDGPISRQHALVRNVNDVVDRQLEQSPSFSSIQDFDISDIILPVDDPLLDKPLPPSPTASLDAFESLATDSDEDLDFEDDNDDDTDVLFLDLDDRFVDSGWGGECLRYAEDIDFEFVYALHTFVATVEGQANATKGDTMVLLDDSNSYWWLVRVVKDSSIGYLPAEHIETPTERLARLNKHRNIDLSATMLSDNAEKSRNPLKKAMKRRNAKTVQFAAPTYVEASDNDYSSDEEESGLVEPYAGVAEAEKVQQDGQETDGEGRASSEARTSHEDNHRLSTSSRDSFDREQAATLAQGSDEPQLSPKLVDKTEAAPLKSRKGTPRNTDSFLKDDSIETRKITLTPGLLREDGSIKSASSESARNTSMENLVKTTSPPEQAPVTKKDGKKEKEKKEKKPGMLSGLFKSKKKDKKSKDDVTEGDEKPSNEYSRESPRQSPAPSGRSSPSQSPGPAQVTPGLTVDTRKQEINSRQSSQRGKLSKSPSGTASPITSPSTEEKPVQQPATGPEEPKQDTQPKSAEQDTEIAELQGSEAAFEMAAPEDTSAQTAQAPVQQKDGPLSPLTNMLKSDRPAKAKRSKQRVELDDFDSPAEEDSPNPFKEQEERARKLSGEGGARSGELDESPVEVAPHNAFMHGTDSIHIPMPGQFDQEEDDDEDSDSAKDAKDKATPDDAKDRSLGSSPSLIERPSSSSANTDRESSNAADDAPTPPALTKAPSADDDPTPTGPRSPSQQEPEAEPPWSDAALRAWLEDGGEVRDMMLLIHDTRGVQPAAPEHPAMKGLFVEERAGVGRMMGELDGLLEGFLKGRGISLA